MMVWPLSPEVRRFCMRCNCSANLRVDSNAEVYQSHAEEWLYELQQRYLDSTGGMIELPPRQSLQAERPHLHAEGRSEVMDYTATRATRDIRLSNPMGYNLAVLMAGEQGVSVNDRPGRPGEPATISVGAAVDMFDPSGQPRVVVDADLIKADVEDTPDIGNLSVDPSDAKVAAPQVDKAEELEVVVDADQRAMTSTTGPTNKLSEEDERLFEDTKLKGNYTSHLRETLGYYAANAREIASEDDDNEDPPDEINLGPPTWDGFTTWFYRQKAAAEAEADGNFVRDKLRPRRQERITARSQTSAKVKDWSRDPYGSLANDPQLRRNNTASLAFRRKMDAEDLERSKK